jgi:DmsE family decaheme c-type cytochrome
MGQLNPCVRGALRVAVIALGLTFPLAGQAGDNESHGKEVLSSLPEGYADADAGDCMDCHDENSEYPVISILATQHAVMSDSRTPLAQQHACQTCHGGAAAHLEDESTPPPVAFGPEHPSGPQDEACLGCHQGGDRINWQGSVHESSDVACASCHTIHTLEDPIRVKDRRPDTPVMRVNQTAVCLQCHTEKRAEINKTSSHPIRDGLIDCSDCHSPHGSMGPTNLVKPTVNETCYTCHAEKRGPFLWEHAPVSEDCTTCHTPHGSNHPTLLTVRVPQLCQQCHVASRHPSTPYGGPDYSDPVPGGTPVMDRRVGSRGCLNCHTEVHGSNHPSGSRWTR